MLYVVGVLEPIPWAFDVREVPVRVGTSVVEGEYKGLLVLLCGFPIRRTT